jgi:hypothetical protein
MDIFCRNTDMYDKINWCNEIRLCDGEFATSANDKERWERCIELIKTNKAIVIGDNNVLFVLFTENIWNPYMICTNYIDEVSAYLCSIKKKDE